MEGAIYMATELGNLLRKLRGKESLREVSKRAGTSHTYLGVIEKGIDPRTGKPVKPTPQTLRVLSKTYNYPYEELMKLSGYLNEGDSAAVRETKEVYALKKITAEHRVELENVLQHADVAFKGKGLSEAERKKVLDMLTLLFHETVEDNKLK
jgi:transcriptional regulator with XRE-family HTH domain